MMVPHTRVQGGGGKGRKEGRTEGEEIVIFRGKKWTNSARVTIQNRQHQSFSHIRSYSFFSEFELLLELNSILSCGKGAVFARDSTALLGQRQHPSQSTLFPVPPSPLRRRRQSLSGPQERKEKKSALKSHFFLCVSNMWGMGRSGALLRLIGPIDSGSRFDGGMPLPPLLLFSDEEVELRDESEERELAGFTLAFSHRFPKRRRRNHFFFVIARPFYKGGAHPRSKQKESSRHCLNLII